MKKVNLFVLGYPKSGTTSLFHYLSQHPNVFKPSIKEPHFFATDFIEEAKVIHGDRKIFAVDNWKHYAKIYSPDSNTKIVPDFSTSYIYSKKAIENIHQYNTEAKFIVVYRDAAEIIKSWFSHLKYLGIEPIEDLNAALKQQKSRIEDGILPKNAPYDSCYNYSELIKFEDHYKYWSTYFLDDSILVLSFKELSEKPKSIMKKIFDFLEIEDVSDKLDYKIHNQAKTVKSRRLQSFIRNFISSNTIIYKTRLLFPTLYEKAQRFYHHINSTNLKRKKISENILPPEYNELVYRQNKFVKDHFDIEI